VTSGWSPYSKPIKDEQVTKRPFTKELPRLLKERGLTLRALARNVGAIDHAYLSRMVRGQLPVNVQHVRRIARCLGLPEDYFPEVREAAVVDAVRRRPKLRDEIYFEQVKRKTS
jgi:transcriptional regulator with XRE-family HTH domain